MGGGDGELGVAEEILATTEAHWALDDGDHLTWSFRSNFLAWCLLEELDGWCAATTANRDLAVDEDLVICEGTGVTRLADVAFVHAHLVLATLTADEAIGEALAAAKALESHESTRFFVRLGQVSIMPAE